MEISLSFQGRTWKLGVHACASQNLGGQRGAQDSWFLLLIVSDSTNQEGPWRTSGTEVSVPQGRVIARGPHIHTYSSLLAREMMPLRCVYNYFLYVCRCHHDQKEKLYQIHVRLLLLIQ